MNRKRTIVLCALATFVTLFCVLGYHRGGTDFVAVRDDKDPVYAWHWESYLDGGRQSYIGVGYTVYKMERILRTRGSDQLGYLGGAQLKWWFPLSVFVSDYESYHYIPD